MRLDISSRRGQSKQRVRMDDGTTQAAAADGHRTGTGICAQPEGPPKHGPGSGGAQPHGTGAFGTYDPNLPAGSGVSSALVAARRLSSTTSGLRSALGRPRESASSASSQRANPRARARSTWRSNRAMIMIAAFLVLVLVVSSLVGWFVTYSAGVRSVQTIGERLEEHYPPKVMKEVQLRMEPARVHLQQGIELLHLKGLDPTTWEAYEAIRLHGVSFLLNYFDDAQCCYGFFTNMKYEPGVNEDNFGDDRALFDAVILSREPGPEPNTTIPVLTELRPSNTSGSAVNEVYSVPFNMTDRKLPRPLVVTDYENLGFVHFPRDDGVNPENPKSGWWNVINSRDMREGDFCFSPIFVWNINEPVTLKIHALVPLWASPVGLGIGDAATKERVGAYVVGFKLHFLSKYLDEVSAEMQGANIFIVERDTGFIIACDNVTMPLMSEDQQTIHTHNISGSYVKTLSHAIAPDGNWSAAPQRQHSTTTLNGVPTMIFLDSYKLYCLDWVVVVAVPQETVLEGISSHRVSTVVASVSAPITMVAAMLILVLVMPYAMRRLKRAKSTQARKDGPPKAGEQVTMLISDIQGSTELWDLYPDEMAKDIAIHHQCLRAELKKFNGYELWTQGGAMHIVFHTPEDAICFSIQVQLNLLCAPWSPVVESGLDKLEASASWANVNMPMMEHFHASIIKDLPFNGAYKATEQTAKHGKVAPLFSVQAASESALSLQSCKEMPMLCVFHSSSTRPLPVFRGLRVRMGIHSGVANSTSNSKASDRRTRYGHQFMEIANAVSSLPCGGQIVMTADTLAQIESMNDLLARVDQQCQGWRSSLETTKPSSPEPEQAAMSILHLGAHVLLKPGAPEPSTRYSCSKTADEISVPPSEDPENCHSEARMLKDLSEKRPSTHSLTSAAVLQHHLGDAHDIYQVVPWPLRARAMYFPPVKSEMEVTPAWEASPSSKDVTILFTFIENWTQLKRWERSSASSVGVLSYCLELHDSLVRTLLLEHNGYEVECEDGCFVCAFQVAIDAMEFSVALQEGLLHADWHPNVLTTPWACEQLTAAQQLLNRGLRVAVGMCTGNARRYQPSMRTGRMEYFGPIMNHAARVAVAAHGGQILVHSNCLSNTVANPQMLDLFTASIQSLGQHRLKGITKEVQIFQVAPQGLEGRVFPPIKTSTTKLMQQDENADSIFRYGLDHVWPTARTQGSRSAVDDSASLREYEKFAARLMSTASSTTGPSEAHYEGFRNAAAV